MIGWKERQERIEARGAEYRAGTMTEEQFRAYLFGARVRGEDIRHELATYQPSPIRQSWNEARLEASRNWIRNYHDRRQA